MQQNYPENVIVTVRLERVNLEKDIRLSTDRVFESWLPELTWILKKYCETDIDPRRLMVSFDGRELRPKDTLASLGAWDGSVLWLEER